ncbi:MAG: DUF433 domain-containing protein [Chloroflexi bacterium]|nr:DUF433 domain-containing protein [Chloroflexota bacterium]
MVEIVPGIVADKDIHFGKPVIKGTRVPVETVLGALVGGTSFEEIVAEYGITKDDIIAALNYALKLVSGRARIRRAEHQ